jgi:hypothetical protein
MKMLDSEKMAIAAHLHVVMRRKVGRVTDVEWIVKSPEYAREVIRIARMDPAHAELVEWGDKLEAALFPPDAKATATREAAPAGNPASGFGDSRIDRATSRTAPLPARYVGSLR